MHKKKKTAMNNNRYILIKYLCMLIILKPLVLFYLHFELHYM